MARANRAPLFLFVMAALTVTTLCPLLQATTVKQMNILELVTRSNKIVAGRIVAIREDRIPAPGGGEIPLTIYTMAITDRLKGRVAETIELRFVGTKSMRVRGNYGFQLQIPGMPKYGLDDEVLIFLTRESRVGMTSPVGLMQGSFRIYVNSTTGTKMVTNGVNNSGLFKGVRDLDLPATKAFSQAERNLLNVKSGGIDYSTFVSLTRKLSR
jgi:hypothetical protein